MGLVTLVVVGALFGWLASIVMKIEDGREIGASIAAAMLGALALGLIAARGSFLAGISVEALLWAALGAVAGACLLRLVRERVMR